MQVLKGVKVLEVAQFIFVPSAGVLLGEWGADVIKVEHPVRGDAQRGMMRAQGTAIGPERNPMIEFANRGKRSIGIDIASEEGRAVLYDLARDCDVFVTNYLPAQRRKFGIDLEQIRSVNPRAIYVRGSALGEEGPERERGGYDATTFWARSGIAHTVTPAECEVPLMPGVAAFGDTIAGMTLAGGIAAALYHRASTGEATEVDVSLLSTAWWTAGITLNMASFAGAAMRNQMPRAGGVPHNPLVGFYRTADGGVIEMYTLVPDAHLASLYDHLGLAEMKQDARFTSAAALAEHWEDAAARIAAAFAARPTDYWKAHLMTFTGQWAAIQSPAEFLADEQALANDMLMEIEAIDGGAPLRVVRGPVRFGGQANATPRAPQAYEHTEELLLAQGYDWDRIAALKEQGVVG